MAAHIALIRGINVGGHNRIAMADLRGLLADLGFAGARSLLQSGNLVFNREGSSSGAELEALFETQAVKHLDLRADFLVRTAREWARVVKHNPFPEAAERDPSHLLGRPRLEPHQRPPPG